MKPLLLVCLLCAALSGALEAAKGTITISKPASAKPASNVFITVTTKFIKVSWLYVDGQFHGRRDHANPGAGVSIATVWTARFPQITTQDGKWEIKVTGTDINGETVTTTTSVLPTAAPRVPFKLWVTAPMRVRAPSTKLWKFTALKGDPNTKSKVEISPLGGLVEPGGKLTFTTKAFDEEGELLPDFQPPLRVTGGVVKKGNVWIAPQRPGRYRISTHFRGAVAQAFVDVGKAIPLKVTSWGMFKIRVSGATFIKTEFSIDPNLRGTITILALLVPSDQDQILTIKVEGLDDKGVVQKTEEVVVAVPGPG